MLHLELFPNISKIFSTSLPTTSLSVLMNLTMAKKDVFHFAANMTQYSPISSPACCVGNVHRAMPNFTARMWMTDQDGGITAALLWAIRVPRSASHHQ